MSDPKDPPRFDEPGSEAPPELSRLFSSAKQDLPSSADLARLEAKLGPLLAAPAGGPSTPSGSALGKVAVGLVAAGAAVGGLWLALRPSTPEPVTPAPSETATVAAPRSAEPPPVATPAPAETSATPAAPSAPAAPAAPSASARAEAGCAVKRPSGIPEDQLLEQARSALRSNPAQALSLARQHQLDFPHGALAQEREVIAIEALRRLGRTEEAARRTERFERLYPQSPHQRKLDAPQRGQ
ncbi:MAG TPA: hypothetical protein VGK73_29130 [Polyangiaceae bacterium]